MKKLFSLFFALMLVAYSYSAVDVGAVTVILPSSPMCPDGSATIKVRIRNNAATTIFLASDPVTVTVDITGASTQTFSTVLSGPATALNPAIASIVSGGTKDIFLTLTADLSAIGVHDFDIYATVVGDADLTNDHQYESIVVEEPIIADRTTSVCSGTMFTDTPLDVLPDYVPSGTTYDWGLPVVTGGMTGGAAGTGAASITGTLSNPTNTAQTATYTITPTSGSASCVGAPFDLVVTVDPTPVIADATDATCSGVMFDYTPADVSPDVVPAGTTYDWGLPVVTGGMTGGATGTGAASISGTLTNPTSSAQTATYTVTPTSGGCPGTPFDLVVTVNPIPVIADDALSACSGIGFALAPADVLPDVVPAGTTYDWGLPVVTGGLTGGATGTAEADINGTLTNPTTSNQTATYTVTPSITGCSGTPFDVVVTVNPAPVVVDEATSVCSGSMFTVTPADGGANSIPVGTTYSWGLPVVTGGMTGGATGAAAASITGTLTNPTSVSQTATYTVTPSFGGCDGATFEVEVTVNPTPVIADDATNTCSGIGFTHTPADVLPDLVPAGTTYSWGLPVVTGAMTGGATGAAAASITGTLTNPTSTSQTATYTVTPSAGGCPGATFDLVVTVDPAPSIADDAAAVCSANPFSVTPVDGGGDIVPAGTTYSWGLPVVTGGMTGGAIGAAAASVSGTLTNPTSTSQTATYTVTPSAGGCDGPTFDVVVTVDPAPSISDDATATCSGIPFSLTPVDGAGGDVVPAGTTYDWGIPVVTGGITGGAAGVAAASVSGTLTNPTNAVQTATYTVTPSFSGCNGPTFDVVVTVNPTPVIADDAALVCSGSPFTVAPVDGVDVVPAGTTYDWGMPVVTGGMTGGATGTAETDVNGTLTNPTGSQQTGTYTVTPTVGTCVGATFDVVVSVDPQPTYVISSSDPTACGATDGSITISGLNASTNYDISYDDDAVPVNLGTVMTTVGGTYVISGLDAGSYDNFLVTITASGCSTADATNTVLTDPGAPVVDDIADQTLCDAGYTLPVITGTGLSGSEGYYSLPGGAAGGGVNYPVGTVINTSGTTIYIYDELGLCTAQQNFTVTINNAPVIADKTANICSGDIFTVTPADVLPDEVPAGTTYDWGIPVVTGGMTGGAAGVAAASISGTLTNPTSTAQTATYTVTPTADGCPGAPFDVVVTVNPASVIADEAVPTCSGVAFSVTPADVLPNVVPGGTTYDWGIPVVTGGLTGGAAGVAAASISGTLTNPTNTAQTATYTVTSNSGSCPGATFDVVVTVNPTPAAPAQTPTACSGSPFGGAPVDGVPTAATIIPVGTTYSWGIPVVTGGITGGAAAAGAPNVNGTLTNPTNTTQTATYTVTPTAAGCAGSSFTATFTVNPAPVIADDADAVCTGIAFSVTPVDGAGGDIVPAGTTYDWGIPVVTGGMTGGAAGVAQASIDGTLTNNTNAVQTATYTVTPSAGACDGSDFTIVVTVNPMPSIADDAVSVCSDVAFSVTPVDGGGDIVPAGTTYDWGLPAVTGGLTGGATGTVAPLISGTLTNPTSTSQTATYTVTPTSGTCVGATFDLVVTVDAAPTFALTEVDPTICGASDGSITITGLAAATNYDISYDDDAAPVNLGTVVSTGGGTYVISGLNAGSYDNFVVAFTASGCSTTDAAGVSLVNPGAPDVDDIADQVLCDVGYTLPVITGTGLTGNEGYFDMINGGGTAYNPGDVINSTMTLYIYDNLAGCSDQENFSITINTTPVIANTTVATCTAVAFSVTPANVLPDVVPVGTTYDWGVPVVTGGITGGAAGVTAASIGGTLTNPTSSAQTATYTVTPTANGCVGTPFTLVVTVNPYPVIADDILSACSGTAFSLTPADVLPDVVPAGTTYDWGLPVVTGGMTGATTGVGAASISGTLSNPTAVSQTATYTITPGIGTCIGATFDLVVTVDPAAIIADVATATCSGTGFTVTPVNVLPDVVAAGTTYSWGAPVVTGGITGGAVGAAAASVSGTLTNPTNTAQTATYTVTPTTAGCAGGTFDVVVTVNPMPSMADVATPVCTGVVFSVAPANVLPDVVPAGTTYDWGVPAVTGGMTGGAAGVAAATISGTLTNSTSTSQTATYTVTPTSGTCVGASFDVVVTVNPTPVIADDALASCSGVAFTLTPANVLPDVVPAGTTYSWGAPVVTGGITGGVVGVAAASVSGTLTNPTNTVQTATYTVTPTAGTCAGATFDVVVTLNPTPVIADVASPVCTGVAFSIAPANVLPDVVPAGTTYDWGVPVVTGGMTGGAAGVAAASIDGTLTNPTNTAQTATYTVTPTAGTCVGASFDVVMTVNPYPVIADVATPICSGALFTVAPTNTLPDIVPAGTTYTWAMPVVTGGMTGGATGTSAANVSGTLTNPTNTAQTATYTVTPSIGACTGATFDVVVTVDPSAIIADVATAICSGTGFTVTPANVLPDVVPAGTTYSWGAPVVTGGITGGAVGTAAASVSGTLTNPTNTVQTATYTVTPTTAGCAGGTFDVVVTVNPMPSMADVATPVCTGVAFSVAPSNVLPDVVPAGTTYDWGAPAVTGGMTGGAAGVAAATISGTLTNSTSTSQTATYTVTPTSGTCVGASFDVVVTVNPTPVIADDALSSCSGVAFTLTPADVLPDVVPAGTTYSWGAPVVTGGITGGAVGAAAASVSGALTNPTNTVQTATYTVTPTAGTCAGATFDVVVTLNPTPVIADVASPVCTGVAFSIAPANVLPDVVPAGTTYDWGVPVVTGGMTGGAAGVAAASIDGTLTNSTSSSQTATYTVTPTSGVCAGAAFDVVITVNAYPVIADVATSLCSGNTFTVVPVDVLPDVVPAGTTYDWAMPVVPVGISGEAAGVSAANISGTLTNVAATSQIVTYTVTPTNGGCVGATFDVAVSVDPASLLTLTSAAGTDIQTVCNNSPIVDIEYTIGGGATGVSITAGALPSGVTSSFAGGVFTITGTPTTGVGSPFSFTLTTSGGSCAPVSVIDSITVISQTIALTSAAFTNSQEICTGASIIDIEYTVGGGATGAVISAGALPAGLTTVFSGGVFTISGTPDPGVTGTFFYDVTSTGPCGGATEIGSITVNPLITLNTAGADIAICEGTSTTLIGGAVTGGNGIYTYLWESSTTAGGPYAPATGVNNGSNYTTDALLVDTYFIRTVTSGGCSDIAAEVAVTIDPLPTASAGGSSTICSDETVIVPGATSANGTISWSHNGAGTLTNGTTLAPTYTPTVADAGNTVILTMTVTGTNTCGTSTVTATYTVNVNPLPTASAGGNETICIGDSATVSGATATNGTILWTSNGAGTITNGTTLTPTYVPVLADAGTTVTLTMTVSSTVPCTPPIAPTATYTIVVNPLPAVPVNAGVDDTLSLGNSVTLNAVGGLIASWNWSPALTLSNSSVADPIATPDSTITYVIDAIHTNGCHSTDSVTIVVLNDFNLVISNTMTPNGDGKNDTWIIGNILNYPNTEVIVVNREGQIVYEDANYLNTWGGTYNGKLLPDAAYYYIVKYGGSDKVYKGAITILHDITK